MFTNYLNRKFVIKVKMENAIVNWEEIDGNKEIINIYVNGSISGFSAADATLLFKKGNVNVALVRMSFPVLKSLFETIGQTLRHYEEVTKEEIVSQFELQERIEASIQKK